MCLAGGWVLLLPSAAAAWAVPNGARTGPRRAARWLFRCKPSSVCVDVYVSLCFIRTVRNLKPHVESVAQTDVLIILTDGINYIYRDFTFEQHVTTVHDTRETESTGKASIRGKAVGANAVAGALTAARALAQPRPSPFPSCRPSLLLWLPLISVQICDPERSPELQAPGPGFTAFGTCQYFSLELRFDRIPLAIAFTSHPAQLCRSQGQVSVPFTAYVFGKERMISNKTIQVQTCIHATQLHPNIPIR